MRFADVIAMIEGYYYRRKIRSFTKKMDKLPFYIFKARLTDHAKVQMEKTFKLAMLQLFKPKTKQERRDYLKS